MPTVRSTGQQTLPPEEPLGVEQIAELRHVERNAGFRAREEIARRIENAYERKESDSHDEAVEAFDYAYKDVTANPALLREVMTERQRAIEEAAKNRQIVDWHRTYSEIGEKVRQRAGLPTSEQRERYETLEEMRKSRGLR